MLSDLEAHNYREIERLNQRGGRTLSTVDLIEDGTLSVELAAHLSEAVLDGASFLTAAGPGGVGKSTLLACLLNMLPPETRVVTVSDAPVISDPGRNDPQSPECFLAHEIGSGHWFGYIWGEDVPAFFGLMDDARRIASCLHADTLEETRHVLVARLGVPEARFNEVDLVLFMVAVRHGGRILRRVSAAYERNDSAGEHRLICEWDAASDSFRGRDNPPAARPDLVAFWQSVVAEGVRDSREVRRRYVEAAESWKP